MGGGSVRVWTTTSDEPLVACHDNQSSKFCSPCPFSDQSLEYVTQTETSVSILRSFCTGCRTNSPRYRQCSYSGTTPSNCFLQDLVFIEEAFERLLLDYDRVFSAMGVPACLWRRTGEIYKGNREFTELVGVDGYMMRDVSWGIFIDIPPPSEMI